VAIASPNGPGIGTAYKTTQPRVAALLRVREPDMKIGLRAQQLHGDRLVRRISIDARRVHVPGSL
jgi:hypothetical protein